MKGKIKMYLDYKRTKSTLSLTFYFKRAKEKLPIRFSFLIEQNKSRIHKAEDEKKRVKGD